jgi:Ca2+-binding EF-hand superfamily protein
LDAAFRRFDVDGSKTISLEEIKNNLCAGKNIDDNVWKTVIAEAFSKTNGGVIVDGAAEFEEEINFEDFKRMMDTIFN